MRSILLGSVLSKWRDFICTDMLQPFACKDLHLKTSLK